MKQLTPYILLLFLTVPPSLAKTDFDVNSMPNLIAPLNWNISDSDINKFAKGAEIQPNNYNAIYFGNMIRVEALIITKVNLPQFDDAQITVEKLNGRIIGVRVDTTESDPRCWNDQDRPKNCRRDDLRRLKIVFRHIYHAIVKQYGPGVRKKADSKDEQLISWKSEQGQLKLFLQKGEFDGWYVGLWIARR